MDLADPEVHLGHVLSEWQAQLRLVGESASALSDFPGRPAHAVVVAHANHDRAALPPFSAHPPAVQGVAEQHVIPSFPSLLSRVHGSPALCSRSAGLHFASEVAGASEKCLVMSTEALVGCSVRSTRQLSTLRKEVVGWAGGETAVEEPQLPSQAKPEGSGCEPRLHLRGSRVLLRCH